MTYRELGWFVLAVAAIGSISYTCKVALRVLRNHEGIRRAKPARRYRKAPRTGTGTDYDTRWFRARRPQRPAGTVYRSRSAR